MSNVATPVGGTQQSELVTVSIDGQTIGVFDSLTGGDVMAPPTKFRSGGQYIETSYQTLPKFSDISVGRVLNLAVDWEVIRNLRTKAGRVPMTVTVQPLDADLNAYGNSQTATGLFLGVKGIKVDSNSEAIQDFMLDMSTDAWS
jgi:hypothetical protein